MKKIYNYLIILLLLITTIISLCTLNLIGISVNSVSLYGVITKNKKLLKVWYIGHIITIIISIIITAVSLAVVFIMSDIEKDDDTYEQEEYNELKNIYNITKIVLLVSFVYTGLAILVMISIKTFIKKMSSLHRQRKEKQKNTNNIIHSSCSSSRSGSSTIDVSSEPTSSIRSFQYNSQFNQYNQYDRRKSQSSIYSQQTRRYSQQLPQRRQSQPSISMRLASINNSFIGTPGISQSPHHSQNSIRLHNVRSINSPNSLQSNTRKSSPSINKPSSLDNIPYFPPHDASATIPEDQYTIDIENDNPSNSNSNSNNSLSSSQKNSTNSLSSSQKKSTNSLSHNAKSNHSISSPLANSKNSISF